MPTAKWVFRHGNNRQATIMDLHRKLLNRKELVVTLELELELSIAWAEWPCSYIQHYSL